MAIKMVFEALITEFKVIVMVLSETKTKLMAVAIM